MKLLIFIFLLSGLTPVFSQNMDINQLLLYRATNYKIVDKQLLELGWEKPPAKEYDDIYKTDEYFINKGSEHEKVLTLNYTVDYQINNNSISYTAIKDESYYNLINQIKSSGYALFKSNKNRDIVSDYYQSEKFTIIVSVIQGVDSLEFIYIYLSTNEEYYRSHKE